MQELADFLRANQLWIAMAPVVMLLACSVWVLPEIIRDVRERRAKELREKWYAADKERRRKEMAEQEAADQRRREAQYAADKERRRKEMAEQEAADQRRREAQYAADKERRRREREQEARVKLLAQTAALSESTWPTIPLPGHVPTVPLPYEAPQAPKVQQPTKPMDEARSKAPQPNQTRPLPKPSVKRNAPPRRAAPPGTAPAPWHVAALPGFRNLWIIGSGGFADVLYGEDKAGSPQAIKVLRKSGAEKELAEKLFRREARMLAALRSPSIPRLISSHVDASMPYFAMEYIDGTNLREHVKANGAMTNTAVLLDLANSTADALAEIHENDFLHRDIKPSNVMASRSSFKLIDLGIGKDLSSPSTSSAARMGTIAFMAPEYMNGQDATAATDVFSWGAMIGFAMTGMLPYGDHPEHVLMRRVSDGRLDGRFLQALEGSKLRGVTHQMLAYVVGVSIRIDPAGRDMNFRELLRVLQRLHSESVRNSPLRD